MNERERMQQATGDEVRVPIDVQILKGALHVVVARLPRSKLTEPFFVDSLAGHFNIANVNKVTPDEQIVLVRPLHFGGADARVEHIHADAFCAQFERQPLVQSRTKFIFHMSRCGSTLVAQMLASCDRMQVVSEPTVVNALLAPRVSVSISKRERILRAVLNSFFTAMPDQCQTLVVKFRSWNTLFLANILGAFADVQWMFVHRSGAEVLESVLRDPPGWLRSRHTHRDFFARAIGVRPENIDSMKEGEYAARLLGAFCANARRQHSLHSTFLDYSAIKDALPRIANDRWGLKFSPRELETMIERSKLYSKADSRNQVVFVDDSERKRMAIDAENLQFSETFVESVRSRLNPY